MPWCPYTDKDLPEEATNPEHIVPLSLGGSNEFCIPVDKNFNSKVGGKIDGAMSNDFLTVLRRQEYDARGHSNIPPVAIIRRSYLESPDHPIQVTLGRPDRPLAWDMKLKRGLNGDELAGKKLRMEVRIGVGERNRFIAKVALSAGYFIYGKLFRQAVRHSELRAMMNYDPATPLSALDGFGLRGYNEFSEIAAGDREQKALDEGLCQLIKGSCVMAIPGPANIVFVVGILGKWIGTLNVPATTAAFGRDGDHDLGHVVVLQQRKMLRMPYRALLQSVHNGMSQAKSLGS